MVKLDLATVAAAGDAWVWTPEGSQVVETAEYRLVRFPDRFPDPLQVQWVRSARPARAVLDDVVARAAGFGVPAAVFSVRLTAPDGLEEALLDRGAQLTDTADVLALPLPADLEAPAVPGVELRWVTEPEQARDANAIGIAVFGGSMASDEVLAQRADTFRDSPGEGAIVAYLDGVPVAHGGLEIADGVARLWAGAVLEAYRGRGLYRALVAARLAYAAERGATMALTQGRVRTSSPILRRLGFVSYGQERMYKLPLS